MAFTTQIKKQNEINHTIYILKKKKNINQLNQSPHDQH